MLKNILKLDGAQKLSNNEKKSINGGIVKSYTCKDIMCPAGTYCELINNLPKCISEIN
jgi:hypothetical protein